MSGAESSSDDGPTIANIRRRNKRQTQIEYVEISSSEDEIEVFPSRMNQTQQRTSPIILSSRAKRKTQTKLTNFFVPQHQRQPIQRVDPQTALRGTPYHGLNVANKNKYDRLTASEIKIQLQNCQKMLNDEELRRNLPDDGKKIKHKIELLDEALIRVSAREIIRKKNHDIKQKLNFNVFSDSNRNYNVPKTKIMSHIPLANSNRNAVQKSHGLAKNLDKDNLNELINSIHTLSIDANNDRHNKKSHAKHQISCDLTASLYPHQIYGFEWLVDRETHDVNGQPFGGIIADEMGLGKTMQMIALMVHKHKIAEIKDEDNSYAENLKQSDCTLIVCPLSVMNHWESEIKKYTKKGKLIVHKYHGVNRLKNVARLTTNYNVIITTYGCIQSEWSEWRKLQDTKLSEIKEIRKQILMLQRNERRYGCVDENDAAKVKKLKMKLRMLSNKKYTKPILSQIYFKRIVLDEAHQIKNYKSKTHKAICDITSKCYWFMTATPIQNSLDDLFAAFHFLRYKYYSNYTHWKQGILNHSKGIQRIQTMLAVIMLRRLKNQCIQNKDEEEEEEEEEKEEQKLNDERVRIKLPPKKLITHLVEFRSYERFIYNQLSTLMNKIFCGYQRNGSVGKHFSQCLKMLLQLRQSCNSLLLIQNSVHRIHSILDNSANETNNMDITQLLTVINGEKKKNNALQCSQQYMNEIKSALESGNDECPICLDTIEDVAITVCGHRFCVECLEEIIAEKEAQLMKRLGSTYSAKHLYIECPVCRKKLKRSNITRIIQKKETCELKENKKLDNQRLSEPSSKLTKVIEILDNLRSADATAKCVIFSQWTAMLDLIEKQLSFKQYGFCRLDGKMSVQKRNKSIEKLNHDAQCWIMLISLKAGGVGLNLVAANHVIMTDIWWNPAIEDQAFDRVHRIGQTKNVTIHRVVIRDSVEQKVLTLQEKKRKIAQQALSRNNHKKGKKNRASVNLNARDLIDLFRG